MRNKVVKVTVILGVMVLFMNETIQGQSSKKDQKRERASIEEIFEKRDKNQDGKLEISELKGLVSNDFLKLDTDGDGYLSLEELRKASKFQKQKKKGRKGQRPDINELLAKMDTNEDGNYQKKK